MPWPTGLKSKKKGSGLGTFFLTSLRVCLQQSTFVTDGDNKDILL